MTFNDCIGLIASVLFAICGLPQAIKTYKDGNAHGLSWSFILLWLFAEVLMIAYVVAIKNNILMLNYIGNLFIVAVILKFKLFPRVQEEQPKKEVVIDINKQCDTINLTVKDADRVCRLISKAMFQTNSIIKVELNNGINPSSSFLAEAFGGLLKYHSRDELNKRLVIIPSNFGIRDGYSYVGEIWHYINDVEHEFELCIGQPVVTPSGFGKVTGLYDNPSGPKTVFVKSDVKGEEQEWEENQIDVVLPKLMPL